MRQRLMRALRAVARCRFVILLRLAEGPLSLISALSSERWGSVKGALLLRGLRTLDGFPPFWNLVSEGKGARGLRGLPPGLPPCRSLRHRIFSPSHLPSLDTV